MLKDFGRLARCLGLDSRFYRPLMAMDPQTAVEIEDADIRERTIQSLAFCRDISGKRLFDVQEVGKSLCITLALPSKADIESGFWMMGEASRTWSEGGIEILYIDPGTGYHVPEGTMAVYGEGIRPDSSRQPLEADQAKDFVLKLAGLDLGT